MSGDALLPAWRGWRELIDEHDQLVRKQLHKPRGKWIDTNVIVASLGKVDRTVPAAILEARAQKAYVVAVKTHLDAEPGDNQKFVDKITLAWLAKLVAATRLRELARVKIVKRGGSTGARFDISDLVATYYGRKILEGLGLDPRRRRALTSEEYAALEQACAKIKLKLPASVEPTTTELFFDAPVGASPEKKPKKKSTKAGKKKPAAAEPDAAEAAEPADKDPT